MSIKLLLLKLKRLSPIFQYKAYKFNKWIGGIINEQK